MFEYTENNHYRWGWGDNNKWFNEPKDINEIFRFSIGRTTRPIKSFREECINVATMIANNSPRELGVLLSGGVDSQICALALHVAGVKFKAILGHLTNEKGEVLNYHDLAAAYDLCKRYNWEYIEISSIWYSGLMDAWNYPVHYTYKNYSIPWLWQISARLPDLLLVFGLGAHDRIGYDPAMSTQDLMFVETCSQDDVYHVFNDLHFSQFFIHTPEIILSQIDNSAVRLFRNALPSIVASMNHYIGNDSWYELHSPRSHWISNDWMKPLIFAENWPEIIQRRKYTGWEVVIEQSFKELLERIMPKLNIMIPLMKRTSVSLSIENLIEYLSLQNAEPEVWKEGFLSV